ncbi:hypothetical protein [Helicobacter suis]|uniref:Uncharacterized protein n=1 Tax=Helicobacter suis TaxID=104628 RepID=A0A6J4D0F2_9HELI|nr:hypothetical protein [Helicobacter suis]BCD46551.1 hypothetical protein NHP190020_15900 [Helicobacter suis]BCD47540.1 hypothetical protein NHP194003_07440 [Helicobacter suis]BCD49294.1 hypothetical protein NHP194004_07410 [Helicobacter suis]BCD51329.1 hypothetical protein NHP194022_10000 [Helicobacter suis]BCD70884.1 hypothetical protein SNTW_15290 [Helicobacter suis]
MAREKKVENPETNKEAIPDNVIRIETKDDCEDYIEIIFDRPVAEIKREIAAQKKAERLLLNQKRAWWWRLKRIFKRGNK